MNRLAASSWVASFTCSFSSPPLSPCLLPHSLLICAYLCPYVLCPGIKRSTVWTQQMPSKSLAASCVHGMVLLEPKHIPAATSTLFAGYNTSTPVCQWAMIVLVMRQNAGNNSFMCGYLFNNCCANRTETDVMSLVTLGRSTGNGEKAACASVCLFLLLTISRLCYQLCAHYASRNGMKRHAFLKRALKTQTCQMFVLHLHNACL